MAFKRKNNKLSNELSDLSHKVPDEQESRRLMQQRAKKRALARSGKQELVGQDLSDARSTAANYDEQQSQMTQQQGAARTRKANQPQQAAQLHKMKQPQQAARARQRMQQQLSVQSEQDAQDAQDLPSVQNRQSTIRKKRSTLKAQAGGRYRARAAKTQREAASSSASAESEQSFSSTSHPKPGFAPNPSQASYNASSSPRDTSNISYNAHADEHASEEFADDLREPRYTSTSVRELRQADREKRLKQSSRRHSLRLALIALVAIVLVGALLYVYNSSIFAIENVEVTGVEHLTSAEMAQLADVPSDSTLLRVDSETIVNRLKASAWVEDVQVVRVFPHTLQLNVTERQVAAIVEIPSSSSTTVKKWAIATDHVWLMPIPDQDSEAGQTTSSKIYEDLETKMHIKDVPYGTKAEIGQECSDSNINNALNIVSGMTTELTDQVIEIDASGIAETNLILENGVEVAFGKAEDIRDKERVVLEILAQNPDGVSYINVRMVESPTWRAI